MKLRGAVHKYGANVDTDAIIPARYLNLSEPEELGRHCMEDIDQAFVGRVKPGDIIVAGANFGCGSSREHAPIAIKACGVACVVAESFARIFYRNAINIGLPIMECPGIHDGVGDGDILEIDLSTGGVRDDVRGLALRASPFPEFMLDLIGVGGLVEYTRRRIAEGKGV